MKGIRCLQNLLVSFFVYFETLFELTHILLFSLNLNNKCRFKR